MGVTSLRRYRVWSTFDLGIIRQIGYCTGVTSLIRYWVWSTFDLGIIRQIDQCKGVTSLILLYIIDSIILILFKAITYNLYIYILKGSNPIN